MPIYKAKIKCFVGESLREPNEEFEYNGEPNTNIEIVGRILLILINIILEKRLDILLLFLII